MTRSLARSHRPPNPTVVSPGRPPERSTPAPHPALPSGSALRTALAQRPPAYTDAIAWLTGHLTALTTVVMPLAARELPDHAALLRRHATAVQQLRRTLRELHGRLAGDSNLASLDVAALHASLLTSLDCQAELQQQIVTDLQAAVTEQRWAELVDKYTDCSLQAPTRPHPDLPHDGLIGRVAVRLSRAGDRLLDIVDSRSVHQLSEDGDGIPDAESGPDTRQIPVVEP